MIKLLAILSLFGYGQTLILPWAKKLTILEKISLSYLFGLLFITLILFAANLLGLKLTPNFALALSLVGFLLSLRFLWRYRKQVKSISIKSEAKPYLLAVLILASVVTLYGLWGVVTTWDALTLYDFRAQRLVEFGYLNQVADLQGKYFYSYPLFTSLAHTYLYLTGWSSPLIIYAGIYLSLLVLFYSRLRAQKVTETFSLLGTLCVAIAPHYFWHSQIAYTNLPYTIYLTLGLLYLYSYARSQGKSELYIGIILSASSTWIRSVEPFWLVNLVFATVLILKAKHYRSLIPTLLIFVGIERIWKIYSALMQSRIIESTLSSVSSNAKTLATSLSPDNTSLILSAINYFITNAIRPYLPVLILLIVTLVGKVISRSRDWWLESAIVGYYGLALAGTLIFATTQSYWSNIPGSLERMIIFISIPIIYNFFILISAKYK